VTTRLGCVDDATNGGLFMFIADKEANLSAGTLYVAKWTRTSSARAGAATLTWFNIGHATSDEIEALANRLTISDIMDIVTDGANPPPTGTGFTQIHYAASSTGLASSRAARKPPRSSKRIARRVYRCQHGLHQARRPAAIKLA
jgi:hypothetical protein